LGDGGGNGTVTSITATAPIAVTGGEITTAGVVSIADALADGATKGAAAFNTNDFTTGVTPGIISLNYASAQAASTNTTGFLTDTDWDTFNNKQDALSFTAVPDTRTVNGHQLDQDVVVTAADLSLDNLTNVAQLTRAAGDFEAGTITEKAQPVGDDVVLLEDSAGGTKAKKWAKLSNLPAAGITIKEQDNSPSVSSVTEIRVSNDTLTFEGAGIVTIATGGGPGGGGDASTNTSSTVAGQLATFADATGKLLGASSATGVVILTSPDSVVSTVAAPTTALVGVDDPQKLTGKNIQARVSPIPSDTTLSCNSDIADLCTMANTSDPGLTLTFDAPAGTPDNGQKLGFRVQCTNPITYSFNAAFRFPGDVPQPLTCSTAGPDYVLASWHSTSSTWDILTVIQYAGSAGTAGGHILFDEQVQLGAQGKLRFTGGGVTCAENPGAGSIDCDVSGGAGTAYSTVVNQSTLPALTQRTTLDIVGNALQATDDPGNNRTKLTLVQSPASSASVVGTERTITLHGTPDEIVMTGSVAQNLTSDPVWTIGIPDNAILSVARLSNLTTNGVIATSGGNGTLGIIQVMTNPMTTPGDIVIGVAAGAPERLQGAAGFLKGAAGSGPSWSTVDLNSVDVTGDLPYANLRQAQAAARLLGRGSLAGPGDWEETTVSSPLAISGTALGCATCTTNAAALTANQLVIGGGSQATAALGSLGTNVQVLHGNAGGAPQWGAVSLTADVSGILPGANGGTGNGFTAFTGPTTSLKTFTLPDASATILTTNALVTAAQGGTGNAFFAVSGPAGATRTFTFPNADTTILTTNAVVTVPQGGTGAAPAADDQLLVSDSNSTATWRTVNDCTGTNKALTYVQASNSFGCNTFVPGTGDVLKVGTPLATQVGVWTGDGTLGSSVAFTFSGGTLLVGQDTVTPGLLTLANAGVGGDSVTIQNLSTTAGAWNFNLPDTAGVSGQALASGGGGSTAMTWIDVMVNPMTTEGDTLYGGASGAPTRLAGAIGLYYNAAGTAPSWADAATVKTFLGDIALGTGTSGNYVTDVTALAGLKKTSVAGEGQTVDLAVDSTEAGFLTAGALTCGAGTAGKAQVHTTPLQYCDNAATPTLQYAAYGNTLGAATALATTVTSLGSVTSVNGTTIPNAVTLTKTTDKLNVFAATSSLELAGVLSDESGTSGGFQRNPMTTAGDLTYGGASGVPTRLAGAVGLLYNAAGSAPSWADAATVKTFLGVSAPGGSDGQVQYRSSATALGGSSGLTLSTTDILSGRMRTTTETTTTLAATDGPVVKCDTSGGDVTLTLPAASGGLGYWFVINTGDTNQCFVRRGGTDTINGATGDIEAATQWSTIELRTDGASDWHASRGKTVLELADIPNGLITTAKLADPAKTKTCNVIVGDPGAASPLLADDNDSPGACVNEYGADWTITTVACYANAGSPTVTPILTGDGTGTSILTGALTCGTAAWAPGTVQGTPPVVHSFSGTGATCSVTPCSIDVNLTTADGVAKYVVVKITGTLP
jgi:hypothetical protein